MLRISQGEIKLIMDRYESKDGFIVLLPSRRQTAKHKMKIPRFTATVLYRSKNTLRRAVHSRQKRCLLAVQRRKPTFLEKEQSSRMLYTDAQGYNIRYEAVCINGIYCRSLETVQTSMRLYYYLHRSLKW
jgi:hypothetical protein